MKAIKKTDLVFDDGYLTTSEGDIVAVDPKIVEDFNRLEMILQKAAYDKEKNSKTSVEIEDFAFESMHKKKLEIKVETPTIDKKIEMTTKFLEENAKVICAQNANRLLDGMQELLEFADSDKVYSIEGIAPVRFDTKTIGDPLKITIEGLTKKIEAVYEFLG